MSSNLSIITARQDFTSNMISTLQTGADNLTLADMNEEGANMLMLQTRQSLGVTALSLVVAGCAVGTETVWLTDSKVEDREGGYPFLPVLPQVDEP